MARIKYVGKNDPVRIPGVGRITSTWQVVPHHIGLEKENEDGFVVEFDADEKKARGKKARTVKEVV